MRNIPIAQPLLGIEEWEALKEPILSGWVTQGQRVREFEEAFAKIHGVKYAVATTSCTTALHLALAALGIKPGDEVIVPAFTWVATANCVVYCGAKPVFCDVDRATYNIDVRCFEKAITPRTRAVIPVHLFGLCADMASLTEICRKRDIFIVEDAACAAGASSGGRMVGAFGDIGCFSFHPRKIITTGEGGMCVTNNPQWADLMIRMRNHGASVSEEARASGAKPYRLPEFPVLGFNYRMTDLQGALGCVQLPKLMTFIEERRRWADWYRRELAGVAWLRLPEVPREAGHSYQSFVCYVDPAKAPVSRDDLLERLMTKGIHGRPGTHAVHMLDYYATKDRLTPDDFPVARDCDRRTIAIPLHNRMTPDDYRYVAAALKEIV